MPYPHEVTKRISTELHRVMSEILHQGLDNATKSSGDYYDRLNFNAPFAWYNARPPPFWMTWLLAALCTIAAGLHYSKRVQEYRSHIVGNNVSWTIKTRTLISAYIDTDDPWFVINKFTAQSLWFLGGMQLDYGSAFVLMMVVFAVESLLDSLRVVIAYHESASLEDYVPTSDYYIKPKNNNVIEIQPSDVYEDLSRPYMIVAMVFLTQTLLISMVVVDVYHASTFTSLDGTPDCPVAGTLGSYAFYILGIFLALVFMLGPRTNYGSSEQNTSCWLQMLLVSKQAGACATWNQSETKKPRYYNLAGNHWLLWLRFVMSFVVNGIGFHVLIHALPIQVGSQGSFTMVVFRSVGMMYLVDLDDTAGCKMTLAAGDDAKSTAEEHKKESHSVDEAVAIRKIIDEATTRLDALSTRKKVQ